jgi:hypothetical protein
MLVINISGRPSSLLEPGVTQSARLLTGAMHSSCGPDLLVVVDGSVNIIELKYVHHFSLYSRLLELLQYCSLNGNLSLSLYSYTDGFQYAT